MNQRYLDIIQNTSPDTLFTLPHTHLGIHPRGFVVRTDAKPRPFPFTLCPLTFVSPLENPPGNNLHDVIVEYTEDQGDLETLLYTLWELYHEKHLEETSTSKKRYRFLKTLPPRKIIIPCLKRKENLIPTLKRLQMIDAPAEGYHPVICIVEHSPFPELKNVALQFHCEYLWFFLDPRNPELPVGQFNKALCYDKTFLFTSPAEWYLFHDNDVLVPKDFWERLDANVRRAKTQFIQPYTHRCLLNTTPEVAERFRINLDLVDTELNSDMFFERIPGAPGGSLYLKRERYLQVGGHDPNFCWGYGPEDLLFLNKIKILEPIAYADEPPIEMIHLWHTNAASNNPFRFDMDLFVRGFFYFKSERDLREMMASKHAILQSILGQIEATRYNKG